ncbi:unnamed protein product [Bodo saltans]|uniref:Uncharacterized protein n=1 Tax=Bodo saltans TaxID=75058 RepID=A0A0S4IR57_BODSA|nr:unnamed protein product [Bodo saltans]|eukprot:CUF28964.1 unnamed protein product [Bodo saltans]
MILACTHEYRRGGEHRTTVLALLVLYLFLIHSQKVTLRRPSRLAKTGLKRHASSSSISRVTPGCLLRRVASQLRNHCFSIFCVTESIFFFMVCYKHISSNGIFTSPDMTATSCCRSRRRYPRFAHQPLHSPEPPTTITYIPCLNGVLSRRACPAFTGVGESFRRGPETHPAPRDR